MPRAPRVALVCPAAREADLAPSIERARVRFAALVEAFAARGAQTDLVLFRDDVAGDVRRRLHDVDAALVWVNPIEDGRDRSVLDGMLRDVAAGGVVVSTHPDVILRMGTKEVLWATRELTWSTGDIHVYASADEMLAGLARGLGRGLPRVLKQSRGNGGSGVWRIDPATPAATWSGSGQSLVQVLHALRGSRVRTMPLAAFVDQCASSFTAGGRMVDQPFVSPSPAGMVRCYLTEDRLVGFGHQHVTALTRPDGGADGWEPPAPQPRLYYAPTEPRFQAVRARVEEEWVPDLKRVLGLASEALPVVWDADFLCGGPDRYVLCEINVSSVYPYPDSAVTPMVEATLRRVRRA